MPDEKVLIVGSHNGGLSCPDLAMFMCDWLKLYGTERVFYGLMHRAVWQGSNLIANSAEKIGAIEAHPKIAFEAFDSGASVLVFPGGGKDAFRPFHMWNKVFLAEHRGFIKLALKKGVPIVPWVSVGAHHTIYVLADFAPLLQKLIKMGMPWPFIYPEVFPLTLNLPAGLFLGPSPNIPFPRPIHYKICKPIYLVDKADSNKEFSRAFIDECYNKVLKTMQNALDELIESSPYAQHRNNLPEIRL